MSGPLDDASYFEELPCRTCAQDTPHRVVRHADGCVGTCVNCGTPQVCPCMPEEVRGAHEWQACPWLRP